MGLALSHLPVSADSGGFQVGGCSELRLSQWGSQEGVGTGASQTRGQMLYSRRAVGLWPLSPLPPWGPGGQHGPHRVGGPILSADATESPYNPTGPHGPSQQEGSQLARGKAGGSSPTGPSCPSS